MLIILLFRVTVGSHESVCTIFQRQSTSAHVLTCPCLNLQTNLCKLGLFIMPILPRGYVMKGPPAYDIVDSHSIIVVVRSRSPLVIDANLCQF